MTAPVAQLGDVRAGGENAALVGAGSRQDEDARFALELVADLVEIIHHGLVDRVQCLRPVQSHDRAIAVVLGRERFHQAPPLSDRVQAHSVLVHVMFQLGAKSNNTQIPNRSYFMTLSS